MTTLQSPSRLAVAFDDDHAVANAGFALVGVLSEKLGLEELAEEAISIAPFPGRRVATLVHALVAGASCIDDADVLRAGATASVLSHRVTRLDPRHVPAHVHLRPRAPARPGVRVAARARVVPRSRPG